MLLPQEPVHQVVCHAAQRLLNVLADPVLVEVIKHTSDVEDVILAGRDAAQLPLAASRGK
eukprot:3522154-Pyramimonas_sp.AAC.1